MLEKKRMCVCELTAVLKVKQSSVSHHLKILKNAGFVIDIRDGLWIDYELEKKRLNKYAPELLKMLSSWLNSDSQIAKDLKVAEKVDRKDICKT
jgi:ArsR family transcriptional regulator